MKNTVVSGISIKRELLQRIDLERGDISRSRYLSRLVEQVLRSNNSSLKKSLQTASKVGPEEQSAKIEPKTPIMERSDSGHDK